MNVIQSTVPGSTSPAQAKETSWVARHPVIAMVALMFIIAWPLLSVEAADSYGLAQLHLPQWLGITLDFIIGWAPGVAAIVITGIVSGKAGVRELLHKTFRWRVGAQWYFLALFSIAVLVLGGVGVYGLVTQNWVALPIAQKSLTDVALTFVILLGLGILINREDMAWRGFALPRLQSRHGALLASALVAIPEALLHLPLFFTKGSFYQQEGVLAFALFSLTLAIIYTWVFNNTKGSVLICTLMHAAQNAWSNLIAPDNAIVTFYIFVGLLCIVALVLIIVYGPTQLARKPVPEAFVY
jgi:uncharacterized protein